MLQNICLSCFAQARIASLAFEVLYERDPVESLEELFVDKEERPGLRFRLTQAIKGEYSCVDDLDRLHLTDLTH